MTEWRVKELSDMTQVSIRMLRHYDKIGLLKPTYRADNGYRYYNASDLAKLQQIIALKSFGFTLSGIKNINELIIRLIMTSLLLNTIKY